MKSRREFLKAGLIASALPAVARAELATRPASGGAAPLYKALYDTRFAASVAFARRAEALGLAVQAMAGDMTRFWYDDLYHRWRRQPAAIAGLTAHGALFCLERLAWEQRMRVVYRGEHAIDAAEEPQWAAAFADVLAENPRGPIQAGGRLAVRARAGSVPAAAAEVLYSWVIAPVLRG